MKLHAPRPGKKARIEIIPLIDVIFFLLATFVLVSLSMTRVPGIRVTLPQSITSSPHELGESVTVSIDENNLLFWNKEPVGFNTFLNKLESYVATCRIDGKKPRILLNADRNAGYGQCITILDEVRKAGLEKMSIETIVPRKR